jgi:hypothetical protein
MILSFFRLSAFSPDAFETFLDITTSFANAAILSAGLLHLTQPRVRRPLRLLRPPALTGRMIVISINFVVNE